jgi:hypothetical protein
VGLTAFTIVLVMVPSIYSQRIQYSFVSMQEDAFVV